MQFIRSQIRNMFTSLHSEDGNPVRVGSFTVEVDGADFMIYNPVIHVHKASKFNFRQTPGNRNSMASYWNKIVSQVDTIKDK